MRGFQVAPAELEGHLLLHPDVADACVVGIPDEYSGEVPLAFIVPSADAFKRIEGSEVAAKELKKAIQKVLFHYLLHDAESRPQFTNQISCLQHVSAAKVQYKWLAGGVEFIDAIPKNPSGKIVRWTIVSLFQIRH